MLTKTLDGMNLPFPIEEIDIDKYMDVAVEYGVRGVPHLILMDENNNILTRISGAVSVNTLDEAFEPFIKK
jgi:thioredoxin-related protein